MSIFYRLGLWHNGEEPTVRETIWKIFISIYYFTFPVSLVVGAISSDNRDESILLMEAAIVTTVLSLKLVYIIWKKQQILELLNQICVYSIDDREQFILGNDKLKRFRKCVYFLFVITCLGCICVTITPLIGSENKLFLAIGFPLDWRNNEIALWLAFAFVFTQMFLTTIATLFSSIVWYLMINCGLKYDVLGNMIKKMGEIQVTTERERQISKLEKANKFVGELIETIKFHRRIRDEIQQMTSFLAPVFLAQLATSGLCICLSVCSLVFSTSVNLMEYVVYLIALLYHIFEILMVMYFGNEITLSSDRLTYCVFESNWIDLPQSTKKYLIIFAEILKQPNVLIVGKLYSLTLETFTRILNSAYSILCSTS